MNDPTVLEPLNDEERAEYARLLTLVSDAGGFHKPGAAELLSKCGRDALKHLGCRAFVNDQVPRVPFHHGGGY